MNDLQAEQLAAYLELEEAGRMEAQEWRLSHPHEADELAPLLQIAFMLRSAPPAPMRPEFLRESPQRLLRRINSRATRESVTILQKLRYLWQMSLGATVLGRPVLAWIGIAVLAAALLGAGAVSASNSALPGDALYPVKLQVEHMRVAVASPNQRLELELQFIETRQEEIRKLIQTGRYAHLAQASELYKNEMNELASNLVKLEADNQNQAFSLSQQFETALSNNIAVLSELLVKVPVQARPAIENAIEASNHEKESLRHTPNTPPGLSNDREDTPVPFQVTPEGDHKGRKTEVPNGKSTDVPNGKPTDKPPNRTASSTPQPETGDSQPPGLAKTPENRPTRSK
jgi:hypothetical protein